MNDKLTGSGPGRCPFASRRGFLGGAAGGALAALARSTSAQAAVDPAAKGISVAGQGPGRVITEPFRGVHQAGILTAQQNHTFMAAFDLITPDRAAVQDLLGRWTIIAERLTRGDTAAPLDGVKPTVAAPDSGEALGLAAARLTLTFGFGPGLFTKDGHDRYGLAARRPDALADLPDFHGDQLEEARTGGDLSIQACADDPQVVFHAIRQLARAADKVARLRWTQTGFSANYAAEDTPRNLMGFKDGTQNPIAARVTEHVDGVTSEPLSPDAIVWASADGPAWMHGGTYMVVRRIRMAIEHWDTTDTDFQEQTIGRQKYSGAPLGGTSEFDPLDLDKVDQNGLPVIPDNAHVRMAAAASNDGAHILRRAYSYNDGTNVTAERWPPWREGLEYDVGLLFICYQQDPRTGFTKIFEPMSKFDALNQYTTHTGGGLFACPPGAQPGESIGQALFA